MPISDKLLYTPRYASWHFPLLTNCSYQLADNFRPRKITIHLTDFGHVAFFVKKVGAPSALKKNCRASSETFLKSSFKKQSNEP